MGETLNRIGKYDVLKQLGAGYFGTTYLARDIVLDRTVALKVYKPHAWLSIEDVKREVRPLVMLEHANVIRYVDCNVFTTNGGEPGYYVATEYAKDGTLRDCLLSLSPAKSIAHCREVLSGLAACHRMGILHRDLKPENILMSDGVCKIGDFGIARINQTTSFRGDVAGTPIYMAPEQFPPLSKTSRRSDLWSVAVVLYEMLHKRLPFYSVDEIQDPACSPLFEAIPGYPQLAAVARNAFAPPLHEIRRVAHGGFRRRAELGERSPERNRNRVDSDSRECSRGDSPLMPVALGCRMR
jgi:serine/threonine-protein kinase